MSESIDTTIQKYISEHLDDKLPKIVTEKLKSLKPLPVWMTELQLAEYWQLTNKEGELTVHSIRAWTKREENPLPCANMGELRRYNREEVDRWAHEEAARQRGNSKRKGRNGLHAVDALAG